MGAAKTRDLRRNWREGNCKRKQGEAGDRLT